MATTDTTPRTPGLETLEALRRCAAGWEPEARLIGNIRAGDIVSACAALLGAAPAKRACQWTEQPELDAWETACRRVFTFLTDGPIENGYHHCPGCGASIALAATPREQQEPETAADRMEREVFGPRRTPEPPAPGETREGERTEADVWDVTAGDGLRTPAQEERLRAIGEIIHEEVFVPDVVRTDLAKAAAAERIDALYSAAPTGEAERAGKGCPHLHQDERGTGHGLRWHCLDCGLWSPHAGSRVGERASEDGGA